MNLSDLLAQCRVYTAEQSTYDLLPPGQPAVYAFYELFRFTAAGLVDDIVRYKTKYARTTLLDDQDLPERLSIRLRGNPDPFRGKGLELCKKAPADRLPELTRTLMFLSFLNEPLYVGKTNDIKERFYGHHSSDFLFKMKERYKRSPDEFLMFCFFCKDDESRLLESVLIQLINPPYCEQKS